jgi:hypothetical protein
MSDDGTLVSFDESGEAGGETGALYVRHTDGSPAVRLGDGLTPTLSPDGKWVLALIPAPGGKRNLIKLPTGAGESRSISTGNVQAHQAYFFPDGHHILEVGSTADGHGLRLWVQDGENSTPRPFSPEGVTFRYRLCISQDGKRVAALDPEGKVAIYDVAGGPSVIVRGAVDGDEPVQWSADGKSLLVGRTEIPARVFTIDLANGQRKLLKSFSPVDPTGLLDNAPPNFSRDLKSYVYSYSRITSDLYVVDGLK